MMRKIAPLFCAALLMIGGCSRYDDHKIAHVYYLTEDNSMELFGCTAYKLDEKMTADEVTELYISQAEQGKTDGYTPVILALDRRVREMVESNMQDYESAEKFREAVLADTLGGKELFESGYAKIIEDYGGDDEYDMLGESDERLELMLKARALYDKSNLWSVSYSLDMEVDGEGVYLVQVPTENPWEVTAWLPFCGWNECPAVSDMLKECRYWYEEYGAVPAYISGDTMIFRLNEPVSDKQTAREISHQHAVFCSEFLGMTGLDSQTADIMTSNMWSFWWD